MPLNIVKITEIGTFSKYMYLYYNMYLHPRAWRCAAWASCSPCSASATSSPPGGPSRKPCASLSSSSSATPPHTSPSSVSQSLNLSTLIMPLTLCQPIPQIHQPGKLLVLSSDVSYCSFSVLSLCHIIPLFWSFYNWFLNPYFTVCVRVIHTFTWWTSHDSRA